MGNTNSYLQPLTIYLTTPPKSCSIISVNGCTIIDNLKESWFEVMRQNKELFWEICTPDFFKWFIKFHQFNQALEQNDKYNEFVKDMGCVALKVDLV